MVSLSRVPYLTTDEIAALVRPEGDRFAMVHCYIDDSGTHSNAKACVAGGFVADHGPWRKFEAEWRGLLDRFEIPLNRFHARLLYPEPKGWFRDKWTRKAGHSEFLEEILKLIGRHRQIRPVAVTVGVDDFTACAEEVRRWLTGADISMGRLLTSGKPSAPFFYALVPVVQMACRGWPVGTPVHFFFGLGRAHAGYAASLMTQIRDSRRQGATWAWKRAIGTVAFPRAKETPPLQAADFLAFATYLEISKRLAAGLPIEAGPMRSPIVERLFRNCREEAAFQVHGAAALLAVVREAAARSMAECAAPTALSE